MEAEGIDEVESLYRATSLQREDRLVSNLAFHILRKLGFGVEIGTYSGAEPILLEWKDKVSSQLRSPLGYEADTGRGRPFSSRLCRSWNFAVIYSRTHVRRSGE